MDDAVVLRVVPKPATVPPGDIAEPDWDALKGRVTVLEGGYDLGDLNDVDTTGLAAGYIVVRNGADDGWEVLPPVGGVSTVEADGTPVNSADVTVINLLPGLTVAETSPGEITIAPAYAGTGAANSAARSDHAHTGTLVSLTTGAATGVLSSGTRVLRNATGPVLANGITYDVVAHFEVRARNNVNSGICNLLCRVATNGTYPQRSRSVQSVGGVPGSLDIRFHAVLTGAGSGVAEYFAVQQSSGDPVDLRDHEIVVTYTPRR